MLSRVLETEVMDTLAEAVDYDAIDHRAVNRAFVADLLAARPGKGDRHLLCEAPEGPFRQKVPVTFSLPEESEILDLGTGTALIPIELCRQWPAARVRAVDLAENMLEVARRNVVKAGLGEQIRLEQVDAKGLPYGNGQFATVMSNSIVHHLPDPWIVFQEAWRVAGPGGLLFLRDLMRPDDEATLRRLVELYTVGANPHQRQMFDDSLRAALTVAEVRALVARLGAEPDSVQPTSDRHWTWAARKG